MCTGRERREGEGVRARMRVCARVCVCARARVCARVCACACACVRACVCVCTHTHARVRVCVHVCARVCVGEEREWGEGRKEESAAIASTCHVAVSENVQRGTRLVGRNRTKSLDVSGVLHNMC